MVNTIIMGSIGIDTIHTPTETQENLVGGSAPYAGVACSLFEKPGIIAIAGEDFPKSAIENLKNKGINLDGVEWKGKTFAWEGRYKEDPNDRETVATHLNSLAEFDPRLPEAYTDAKYVFLANNDPTLQLKALAQVKNPKLTILDTMDLWINHQKENVIELIKKVDILIINDSEAKLLFNTLNLIDAANQALALGVKAIVIKKGEHGALLFNQNSIFSAPAFPLKNLADPTGCGDCFAGGFLGYLASSAKDRNTINDEDLRKAIIYGTVIASFNAESFSLNKINEITIDDVEERFNAIKTMTEF